MELTHFSIELLSLLFLTSVIAGLIDTLAGGGGLISLPALILSGVPPLSALGTNKLQGSMGTATATYMMLKNKKIKWHDIKPIMLMAFIGSVLGTMTIQVINSDILTFVIPLVLLCIAIYFLVSPKVTQTEAKPKLTKKHYKNTVVPFIGFYDGMFGPGTGSFFAMSGVFCRGLDIIKSTAVAKSLNFSTNIASLIVFVIAGHIVWVIGLLMMFGQIIGAWLGSHFLFKINPSYLRFLVVFMCICMLVKYAHAMGWFEIV